MTKILVVIDPQEAGPKEKASDLKAPLDSAHHVLDRCTAKAPDSDLQIHVVLFIAHESAATFSSSFAESSTWLNQQVASYIADGYKITTEVIPFKHLYQSILDSAEAFDPDFVLKPIRRHSLFQSALRTTTDWQLIRHCRHPLLLVSELDVTEGKPVLAALDVIDVDEQHAGLNRLITRQSEKLAQLLGSSPHAVCAWQRHTPMMMGDGLDSTTYISPDAVREDHIAALKSFADYPDAQVHLGEGPPNLVISQAAERIGAGVIVMGTVARKGLSGALIGNTAEGVLDSSRCDVLVISAEAT